ncbi:MAG: RNA polymerase subunit sigma-70 [Planctomycetes bacterium]|nr:RNA polymerase subunit sigma-70 [Planctomycetota bacterium]
MDDSSSISRWIAGLKEGEAEDIQRLWQRYSSRLTNLARQRLRGVSKRVADEEDIAQSVFHSLCRGAAAGRLDKINGRDDLWWLLLAITRMKVVDHIRREMAEKRGAGLVVCETELTGDSHPSQVFSLDDLIGHDPTPEFLVILEEEHRRLIELLPDDRLKKIANARIEGYTNDEVASALEISKRSVERKLQLIRNRWEQEVSDVEQSSDPRRSDRK